MKTFKQYITEVERYEYDPPIDLDFENDTAWNWTVGPFYNFARHVLSDGRPILPPANFDRYPWTDSLGTWKNPPPGWRVKDPSAPINDRENWEYIPRPHIRGPQENGRWVWSPAGGGKWVYTTEPGDVVPDTPISIPTHQEVPWTQGPLFAQPLIGTSQVNENKQTINEWWWLIPEILGDILPDEDFEEPIYLPVPEILNQDPSEIPIRYHKPTYSPTPITTPSQYPPMGEQEKWDTVFPNSTVSG